MKRPPQKPRLRPRKKSPPRLCDNEACQEGPGGTRKTFIPNRPHQKSCSERCRYEKWAAINRRPKTPIVTT